MLAVVTAWVTLLDRARLGSLRGGVAAAATYSSNWYAIVQSLPTLVIAAASAVAMLVLYQPGVDPTRVYEGTDTRACGLLIGAALAMAWSSKTAPRAGARAKGGPCGRDRRDGVLVVASSD